MAEKIKLNMIDVGARLKELRTDILKMSMQKMRDVTGLTRSSISMIERGGIKPSAAYLFSLAENFDVNINWVLTGKGVRFRPDFEMKLDYGENNELIKEMLDAFGNIPAVRFELLKHFLGIKGEYRGDVDPDRKKK